MSKKFFEKKKRSTQKITKATLSRLLSSKFEKSFLQPFIRYHSRFLLICGTGNLLWPMDYRPLFVSGALRHILKEVWEEN